MTVLEKAISNHDPIIVNLGDDVKQLIYWSREENNYVGDIGIWDKKLLLEIAQGKVKGTTIELMEDE